MRLEEEPYFDPDDCTEVWAGSALALVLDRGDGAARDPVDGGGEVAHERRQRAQEGRVRGALGADGGDGLLEELRKGEVRELCSRAATGK